MYIDIYLELLQNILNFTPVFVRNGDQKFGSPSSNGSWNGLVKMLMDDEIDIAVAPLTINTPRSYVIDFCEPLTRETYQFFIPSQHNYFNWFGYLKPLDVESWICIILCVLLATPILYIAAKQCKDVRLSEFKLEKSFIFSVGALTFARR